MSEVEVEERNIPKDVPSYFVERVWSWRRFQHVLRFEIEGEDRVFYVRPFIDPLRKENERFRFDFWLPWTSKQNSAKAYLADAVYATIVFHYMAAILHEFAKEEKNERSGNQTTNQ